MTSEHDTQYVMHGQYGLLVLLLVSVGFVHLGGLMIHVINLMLSIATVTAVFFIAKAFSLSLRRVDLWGEFDHMHGSMLPVRVFQPVYAD